MDDTVSTRRRLCGLALAILAGLPVGLAACAPYIGTTARSYLRTIQRDPDPNVRYLAYSRLASPQCYDTPEQKAEAVKMLVEKLEGSREPTASRAVICRTLGELGDPSAREALIAQVSDSEGLVRVHACRALGKVGKPEDATVLARIMTVDTLEDCRIAAIDGLGEMKSKDPRILQMLVAGMEHDDPAIRLASLKALRHITGMDRGVDAAAWRDAVLLRAHPAPSSAATPAPTTPPPGAPAAPSTVATMVAPRR
jgi:HEAT repeat protein